MSWVPLFATFLVAHMVGDYLFQTDWQARHKRGGCSADPLALRALSAHVFTYTLAFAPCLVWIANELDVGWAALTAALIAAPHFLLDDGRFIAQYVTRVKGVDDATIRIGVAASVDQSFHVLSLFLLALLVGSA